jgi:uncharacterized small protein (DUF1192 family)
MFDEDFKPKKKPNAEFPRKLVDMSIQELQEYIEELQAEIKRAEDDIRKKKASIDAAAAIFKS